MKRKFIYTDEKSNKFWNIEVNKESFTVEYGKVGTAGQTQEKEFDDEAACKKAAEKLIAEKIKKGYVEKGTSQANPTTTTSDYIDNELLQASTKDDIISIIIKNECEEAYSQALDYIDNLLTRGFAKNDYSDAFGIEYERSEETEEPNRLPYPPVNHFFTNALKYPNLHQKIAQYADLAMRQYSWYADMDGEESTLPGMFAAFGLAMTDKKYFYLIKRYCQNLDNDHQSNQIEFIEPILRKYGVNDETMELAVTILTSNYQFFEADLPIITDNVDHVKMLIKALRYEDSAYRILEALFSSKDGIRELEDKYGEQIVKQMLFIWKNSDPYDDEDEDEELDEDELGFEEYDDEEDWDGEEEGDEEEEEEAALGQFVEVKDKYLSKGVYSFSYINDDISYLDNIDLKLPADTDFNDKAYKDGKEIVHNIPMANSFLSILLHISPKYNAREQSVLKKFIINIPKYDDMHWVYSPSTGYYILTCIYEDKNGEPLNSKFQSIFFSP